MADSLELRTESPGQRLAPHFDVEHQVPGPPKRRSARRTALPAGCLFLEGTPLWLVFKGNQRTINILGDALKQDTSVGFLLVSLL